VDITKQKKLERQIEETELFFQTILENISDAVFLTDKAGSFKFICSNVSNLFGYSASALKKKKNINKIITGLDEQGKRLHLNEEIRNLECTITNKSRKKRSVLVNIKHTAILGGSLLYVCRDITDKKTALSELTRKNVALKEVIGSIEKEKTAINENVSTSVKKLIYPIINMLLEQRACADLATLLKNTIEEITSPSAVKTSLEDYNLSPREIQICNMVSTGMTIKQIAKLLNTSPLTVEKQRKTIRKKLGIADGRTNLSTFLANIK
jgi:PAS domain S-box-containing protein